MPAGHENSNCILSAYAGRLWTVKYLEEIEHSDDSGDESRYAVYGNRQGATRARAWQLMRRL